MAGKRKNAIVKKSNALIRARWSVMSVLEPRIVALLASKINESDVDFCRYEIPLYEILGRNYGGSDLEELSKTVDALIGRVITIYSDSDNGKSWRKYNVFASCGFVGDKGVVELQFHPDLKVHYLKVKDNFTLYSLPEYMSLPSIYSQRLFEILKSYNYQPEIELLVDELMDMLDAPESYRKDFAQFRKRVLDKARQDIERCSTSLWFDWEPIKKGRSGKFAAIRFVFNEEAAKALKKNEIVDELALHNNLQRNSNKCYERIWIKNMSRCIPRTGMALCKFCTERGRMAAKKFLEDHQGKLPFDDSEID